MQRRFLIVIKYFLLLPSLLNICLFDYAICQTVIFPSNVALECSMDSGFIDKISTISSDSTKKHQLLAQEAVRKSLVLLKNEDNVLPLLKVFNQIHIVGEAADNIKSQFEELVLSKQVIGSTIFDGIAINGFKNQKVRKVTYSKDISGFENADVIILVLSESDFKKDGNKFGLSDKYKVQLDKINLKNIPIITVLFSSKPLIIDNIINYSNSFIAAWFPGTQGGKGIADILFGNYSPTGRLPYFWPKSNLTNNQDYLFPSGYGLTYKIALKDIIQDELSGKKEAVILYRNILAIVEAGEKIDNGEIISISDDSILFKKHDKIETIFKQ